MHIVGNLALEKAAVQLSTYFVHGARLAVDGLPNSQSCTAEHDPDAHPWWSVDLKQAHKIAQVTITSGRGNYTYSRARIIHYGQDCRLSAFALCSSKHIKRTISLYSLSSLRYREHCAKCMRRCSVLSRGIFMFFDTLHRWGKGAKFDREESTEGYGANNSILLYYFLPSVL